MCRFAHRGAPRASTVPGSPVGANEHLSTDRFIKGKYIFAFFSKNISFIEI